MEITETGLSATRENRNPIYWCFSMHDTENDIFLLLNSFNVADKYKVPEDVKKVRIFKSSKNTGMCTDVLEVDGFQMDIQEVDLHLSRINSEKFRVNYRIVAGDSVFEIYEGECTTNDEGLILLAETENEIKEWIQEEYPKFENLFKWEKSGWGIMVTLKHC